MAVHKKYNALGRGLDALISTENVRTQGSSTINEIAIDQIEANPNQPRREFDEESLRELAISIREIGIIQPITLRQVADNRFQIIAGERRWRASQMAGLKAIPAYIRTINDENVMEMALVENIQREDLNAIEIALAYEHLIENTGMTQEKVSERVGKSRTAITNYLRLLKLPAHKALQGDTEEQLLCEEGRGSGEQNKERRGHREQQEECRCRQLALGCHDHPEEPAFDILQRQGTADMQRPRQGKNQHTIC